jgi:hypothetical protein
MRNAQLNLANIDKQKSGKGGGISACCGCFHSEWSSILCNF